MCDPREFRERISAVLSILKDDGDAKLVELETPSRYYHARVLYSDVKIAISYELGDDYWDVALYPIALEQCSDWRRVLKARRTVLSAKSDDESWLASASEAKGSGGPAKDSNLLDRDFAREVVKRVKSAIARMRDEQRL